MSLKQKLIGSKNFFLNWWIICSVVCLYLLNNSCFKKCSKNVLQYFFVCYFNDLICTPLLLAYVNLLLSLIGHSLSKLLHILFLCLCAGLVWEFVAPLMKPSSVTDPIDLLCYLSGGMLYWLLLRTIQYYSLKIERKKL